MAQFTEIQKRKDILEEQFEVLYWANHQELFFLEEELAMIMHDWESGMLMIGELEHKLTVIETDTKRCLNSF